VSELVDRIPGEVILSSFHNEVKERTMMRYANLAALEASIALPDPGSFAYLTSWPWPMDPTSSPSDGMAFLWKNDAGDTSPFGAGFRWSSLISDAGGYMYGPLMFQATDPTVPGGMYWRMETASAGSFRIRLYNADDGEANAIQFQLAGFNGAENYVRQGAAGSFAVRERAGSVQGFSVTQEVTDDPVGFNDPAVYIPHGDRDRDGGNPFYPLVFGAPDWSTGARSIGMFLGDDGVQRLLGIARMDSSVESALALPGIVSSSSVNWRVGTSTISAPGGATCYRVERQSGSSIRWKDVQDDTPDALETIRAVDVIRYRYAPGYLSETDERAGVDLWGFTAEQLDAVDPALVDHDTEGIPSDVDLRQLVALAVAGVKALDARIPA